jgi:ribosomal protein L35
MSQAPDEAPAPPQRFDAFATAADQIVPPAPHRAKRTSVTVDGKLVDWKAVRKFYLRCRSIKQTAAHFELSPNTVKARVRREGWGA